MSSAIKNLEPRRLFEYFAELSAIPRCSGHEGKAAAYVMSVAKKLDLHTQQDQFGNVLVRKPATRGREKARSVVLQSHLDMVCEKNRETKHDFLRDPILLERKGNYLTARGTTLGADNGVGVCASLALMEDRSVKHGPLEFLFTVDEETGLNGATNLKSDLLVSRTLINLDSEDEGTLCVGCAGGADTTGRLAVSFEAMPAKHVLVALSVTGLRGGHSGIDIHIGRANAIKLLTRALIDLSDSGVRIASINGGNKRNAIPREAEALLAVPADFKNIVTAQVKKLDAMFKAECDGIDGKVMLSVKSVKGKTVPVLTEKNQARLVGLLCALPHGVLAMSADIKDLVETSTNLATISTTNSALVIETSQRSPVESKKRYAMQMVSSVFLLAGAKVTHGDGYPGWKPNLASPILKTAQDTYTKMFGRAPRIEAIHAGLECGIIGEKYKGMDMISLGPTMQMVHSPEERLHIDSVKRFWDYLVRILDSCNSGF